MYHLSVCTETPENGRIACIITASTEVKATRMADNMRGLVGYCGNDSFREAVERCRLMRIDAPNAWGIISE